VSDWFVTFRFPKLSETGSFKLRYPWQSTLVGSVVLLWLPGSSELDGANIPSVSSTIVVFREDPGVESFDQLLTTFNCWKIEW
jgi:hypothetical protein